VVGYISWGETTSLGKLARAEDSSPKKIHSIAVDEVSPSSNYYFVVNSGGSEFDNNGIPWSLQTGPVLQSPTGTLLASGIVLDTSGKPAPGVLIYINGGAITQLSTTTSQNGAWTIPLSAARAKALTSYAAFDSKSAVLDIFVQGADLGVSTAQILASSANPVPDITLGQSYDFRTNAAGGVNLPEANLNLPEENTEEELGPGGFDLSSTGEETAKVVTLESIEESGEIIFTDSPEFFGEGPGGATITITVESDPVTEQSGVGARRRSLPTGNTLLRLSGLTQQESCELSPAPLLCKLQKVSRVLSLHRLAPQQLPRLHLRPHP
jgi:hypothetical protein